MAKYRYTKTGPNDFLKEEIGDSGSTNNSTSELVRNVPDQEGPLPMPAWNFEEKEKDNQDKKTPGVANSDQEESPLPLPRMF